MFKILILTPQIPYPYWFYGRSSLYFLIKSLLNKGLEIHLSFPIANIKENEKNIEHLKSLGIKVYPFEYNTNDRVSLLIKNIFEEDPFKIKKYWNRTYYEMIENICISIKPDIIQVHTPHMFKYGALLSKKYNIPIILRVQDIVHNQVKTFKEEVRNPLYKFIAGWQYGKTIKYELKAWKQANKIIFITKQDYDYAINKLQIDPDKCVYIYDGINLKDNIYLNKKSKKKAFVFMASDQKPNVISLKWFINIWKRISNKINFEFHVYGKVCESFEREKNALKNFKIFLNGYIDNPDELHTTLAEYLSFISPTIQGSGYRTKIFEAMSIGLPVISTEFDYKPIEPLFEENKDILVFNNEEELFNIIKMIEKNELTLHDISSKVHEKIRREYTWEKTADRFVDVYNDLLSKKGG